MAIWALRFFMVAYAVFQAYAYRHRIFLDDSVQYIDIARAVLSGHWAELINSMWSPLYPLLIAIMYAICKPSPLHEILAVNLLNVAILIFKYWCFELLLRALERWRLAKQAEAGQDRQSIPFATFRVCAIIIFAMLSFQFGGVYQTTPDYLMHALGFLTLSWLFDHAVMERNNERFTRGAMRAVGIGLLLGLGFLSKAVFISVVPVALLAMLIYSRGKKLQKAGLTALAFAIIYAPAVGLLSAKLGYFTTGEAGRINYVEWITCVYDDHHPVGTDLIHPQRRLADKPVVWEFATNSGETYPPYYERMNWLAGFKCQVDPAVSLQLLFKNTIACLWYFGAGVVLSVVLCMLLLRRIPFTIFSLRANWLLYAYFFAMISVYMVAANLSYIMQGRYTESAVMALFLALMASLRAPADVSIRKVKACAAIIVMPITLAFAKQLHIDLSALHFFDRPIDYEICRDLQALGIKAGDRVAQLGYKPESEFFEGGGFKIISTSGYWWAHLAGVQIVIDIPDVKQYRLLDAEQRQVLLLSLADKKVRCVIMYRNFAPDAHDQDWVRLPLSGCYAYMLPVQARRHP